MSEAYINPTMLMWAIERSTLDVERLAARVATSSEKVTAWATGERRPTFNQAQKLADTLHVPMGYLYLPAPPKEETPIPEFRKLSGSNQQSGTELSDLLSDIEFKREWFRDYRVDAGFDKLDFVGRFSPAAPTQIVADDIRTSLQRADSTLFRRRTTYERLLDRAMRAAEALGVWVIRSGVVGNNTHRPIPVELLRGFALADQYVPLVFVNSRDAKAAQVFTFFHELAHIWLGISTIEAGEMDSSSIAAASTVEAKCDNIAAEALAPTSEFLAAWHGNLQLEDQVDDLSERFSVSRIVVARRALEIALIDKQKYSAFFALEKARWSELKSNSSGGGSFYHTVPVRNGKTFTAAVLRETGSGRVGYREAGTLLNVQASKVKELQQRNATL